MEKNVETPRLDVVVDENEIEKGAAEILALIRPDWASDRVEFKLLTDGITNKLVGCKLKGADEGDTVLVRVYGNKTDLLIDRKAETRNILLLNRVGLAPRLFATFQNGLAYEFVPGRTLTDETVVEPHIYKLVAAKMAQLHKVAVPGAEPVLWDKMEQFLRLVPDRFSDHNTQKRYESEVPLRKQTIREEVSRLRSALSRSGSPVVFSHNDLLLGNVIYTELNKSVTFIDFEYAAPNYQAFDIGNHFAEFVGIGDVSYEKYPGKTLQMDWIRTYLEEYKRGEDVAEKEVETLYVQANQFALATHVFWGIWALIQAEHSYIDFDFIRYAAIRFREYLARREEFLSLKVGS